MEITAVGVSDVGQVREHNEDFMLQDDALRLFVVCDGMGGHAAGEVASRDTATMLQSELKANEALLAAVQRGEESHDAIEAVVRAAIEKASRDLYDRGLSDRTKKGMGTTCSAVVVIGG